MAFIRVGIFCAVILLVYYLAFRWCLAKLRKKEPRTAFERAFRLKRMGAALLGMALAGLLCMGYGFFLAPDRCVLVKGYWDTPFCRTADPMPPGGEDMAVQMEVVGYRLALP